MPSKIKNSLLIIFVALLILCALPIYFVINYQKQFNIQAQSLSDTNYATYEITDYDEADYFEYAKTTDDPFYSNTSSGTSIYDPQFFLRKGQSLLISKQAIQDAGNNCGDLAQLKVITTSRPAVLCKGSHVANIYNPQCLDFVEICEFEDVSTTRYKINKSADSTTTCKSITKICLPSIINNCNITKGNKRSTFTDAYKCLNGNSPGGLPILKCPDGTRLASSDEYCPDANCPEPSSCNTIVECSGTETLTSVTATELLFKSYDCKDSACPNNISNIVSNFSSLKTDLTAKPKFVGATPTPSCANKLENAVQQEVLIPITGHQKDTCYDLTDYTGKVEDIPTINNYEQYLGILNNAKNIRSITPISSLSADKYFGNLDYSNSNTIFINENTEISNIPSFQVSSDGLQMKMMFVNNANLSSDFIKSPPNNNLQTKVNFHQNQTYKNGQMLKVALCQENSDAYLPNKKNKYNENYVTQCENYVLPIANHKENLTLTYNSLPTRIIKTMPNSLSDADYFTQDTTENFAGFMLFTHKTDSVNVVPQNIDDTPVVNGVYNNSSQISRSPYMFDKNGWLKLTKATEPRLMTEAKVLLELSKTPRHSSEPICHNYDNSFYCHSLFASTFPTNVAQIKDWEKDQLTHDLRFRLAFQIDDPDINNDVITNNYPNAILDDNSENDIRKGNKAYSNNTGKYEVIVKVTNPAKKAQLAVMTKLDEIVNKLSLTDLFQFEQPIGEEKDQEANKSMFSYLVNNSKLAILVRVSAILMIGIFALMYLMGLSKLDHQTLASMILKIAFVLGLLNPEAWELYQNIFALPIMQGFNEIAYQTLTILSPQDIMQTNILPPFDKKNIATYFYQSIDVMTMLLNQKNHFKIMAIFFSYSYGFVYVFIVYYGFYIYLFATANAILMFILAKIIMILVINLLPLFLLCLFFKTTQKMLDNWFSLVLGYGFQQIFIIIAVAFFNIMIVYILKMILGYKICWDPILKIGSGSLGHGLPFNDIVLFKFWKVSDSEDGNYIPSLFHTLYFLILAYAMKHFINFAASLGSRIAGGVSVEGVASAIKSDLVGNIASKTALKAFNNLAKGMKNRLIDKISFGYSGELADQRIEQANKEIDGHREAFHDVQNELNDYKSSSDFLSLSEAQKEGALKLKANELAQEAGYTNYGSLIKSANQSKKSTSTTLGGLLFDTTSSTAPYGFGRLTNAVTGRNLITGVANDTGNFTEANLLTTTRRISSQDVVEAQEFIDKKIKSKQEKLAQTTLTQDEINEIENQIKDLKIQKELIKLNQTTWSSIDKLKLLASKGGIELALVTGAVGGGVGLIGGAIGGGVAGFLGTATTTYHIIGRRFGIVADLFGGAGLVAIVAGLGGALTVGVYGAGRGAYAGTNTGLEFTTNVITCNFSKITSNAQADFTKMRATWLNDFNASQNTINRASQGAWRAMIDFTKNTGKTVVWGGYNAWKKVKWGAYNAVKTVGSPLTDPKAWGNSVVSAYIDFVKIAKNDAKYNLQQKLKDSATGISADQQEEIINDFIKQIKPYLSNSINLNQLNGNYQETDYGHKYLGKIHNIIEANLEKLNQDKSLFNLFVALAKQEKDKDYVGTDIANLVYSTAGAALTATGYAIGYTTQSMENYVKEKYSDYNTYLAERTINNLISTLPADSQEVVKKFKEEITNPGHQSITTFVREQVNTTDINKAKLLIALQEYAKTKK